MEMRPSRCSRTIGGREVRSRGFPVSRSSRSSLAGAESEGSWISKNYRRGRGGSGVVSSLALSLLRRSRTRDETMTNRVSPKCHRKKPVDQQAESPANVMENAKALPRWQKRSAWPGPGRRSRRSPRWVSDVQRVEWALGAAVSRPLHARIGGAMPLDLEGSMGNYLKIPDNTSRYVFSPSRAEREVEVFNVVETKVIITYARQYSPIQPNIIVFATPSRVIHVSRAITASQQPTSS
jgi:hypothetical protein